MFSSSEFSFCFRQEEGARSFAPAGAPEHFALSSTSTTRILLIGTETENGLDDNPLFPHANPETPPRKVFPGDLNMAPRANYVVHIDSYDGLNSDGEGASALPPPETDQEAETFEAETFEDAGETSWHHGLLPRETLLHEEHRHEAPSALQSLQDALEHTGHPVVVWPCGLALSVLARDLLDFEIVVLQDGACLEDAVSLCHILKATATEAGACLLVALPKSGAEREAALLARRMHALQEAGADGILDGNAAFHEVAAVVHTLAQLARTRRELEATHAQLRLQLQTDDLTNLLNRRFFFQAAHREYERSRRINSQLSCLMVDLDHFRRLSEGFGFECCDAALRCVANVLRETARDGDIVARFGEGKFVFLLPETGLSQAAQIGEILQHAVSEYTFVWRGQTLPMTISVGEATRAVQSKTAPPPSAHSDFDGDQNVKTSTALPPGPLPSSALPLSETLEMRATFSARDEIAALLEEADAALFVAKRGVRSSSLLDTSPLSLPQSGHHT